MTGRPQPWHGAGGHHAQSHHVGVLVANCAAQSLHWITLSPGLRGLRKR
jgi:hypothetical protein